MDRATLAKIVVGMAGVFFTYGVSPPGEHILELGFLRFDPSLSVIAAFIFLAVYGIATSVHQTVADRSELNIAGFGTTEVLSILALAVVASAVAYTTTPTLANVLFNFGLTVVGMIVVFLLFRYFGWWYPDAQRICNSDYPPEWRFTVSPDQIGK